jgi:thiol-disulfide isomerase/thioredoxin
MRGKLFPVAAGALILAFSIRAVAQDTTQNAAQEATKNLAQAPAAQQNAQAGSFVQPEQPMSLGDLARLVRAKKKSEPKAVRIFNEDNTPTTTRNAGSMAPDVSLPTGQSSSLSQIKGKVVLLDFWASWCGPCRESLPGLKQLVQTYASDQLEVISISEDHDESAWSSFTARNQMDWAQQLDADGRMAHQFGVRALPTFVLIGSHGEILQRFVGEDPEVSLVERIGPDVDRALAGKS